MWLFHETLFITFDKTFFFVYGLTWRGDASNSMRFADEQLLRTDGVAATKNIWILLSLPL